MNYDLQKAMRPWWRHAAGATVAACTTRLVGQHAPGLDIQVHSLWSWGTALDDPRGLSVFLMLTGADAERVPPDFSFQAELCAALPAELLAWLESLRAEVARIASDTFHLSFRPQLVIEVHERAARFGYQIYFK